MGMRFTLRELLVVTVLVAVAAAWWIDRNRIAQVSDERDLWTFRAETAAKAVSETGDQMAWKGDAVVWTHTDASGRRFQRMVERIPRPLLPVMTQSPAGVAAAPVRAISRRDAGNKAMK